MKYFKYDFHFPIFILFDMFYIWDIFILVRCVLIQWNIKNGVVNHLYKLPSWFEFPQGNQDFRIKVATVYMASRDLN